MNNSEFVWMETFKDTVWEKIELIKLQNEYLVKLITHIFTLFLKAQNHRFGVPIFSGLNFVYTIPDSCIILFAPHSIPVNLKLSSG